MRLLNTETYELSSFLSHTPPYAILSHTWGEDEVTFDIMSDKTARVKLKGWSKVESCCRRAFADGWEWVWMDTCCINKVDTTELGEAINSMFRWYEAAEICYAYLVDVPPKYTLSNRPGCVEPRFRIVDPIDGNGVPWAWNFRGSRWFTRGWTLQELLAPRFLLFLDCDWGDIGSREKMADEIQRASGIEVKYLWDFKASSVATKMSWAANRSTTREEDRAYSLLGLFDVNIPLIYGEGKRAFLRLQKELIQNQNDESILAWGERARTGNVFSNTGAIGIFGQSPEDFKDSADVGPWPFDNMRRTFSTTNIGISLNAEVFAHRSGFTEGGRLIYAIRLNCRREWPPLKSMRSPIVLLLETHDPDVTVFQRINRYLKNWTDVNSIEWKTIGRKEIFLAHEEPSNSKTPSEKSIIRFEYPLSVKLLHAWSFSVHETTADIKSHFTLVNDSAQRIIIEHLRKEEGICRLVAVNHASCPNEYFWLILRPGPRQPHFGIWKSDFDFGNFGIGTIRNIISTRPIYSYPNAAALENGGADIELAIKPIARDSQVGEREYRLTISLAQHEPFIGRIGRLTYPK